MAADGHVGSLVARVLTDEAAGSGLLHALRHQRPWLWAGLAGFALGAPALFARHPRTQGAWLLSGGLAGLVGLGSAAFAIGARGWAFAPLAARFGELAVGQTGLGLGGTLTLTAFLMLTAFGAARRGAFRGDLFVAAAVFACAALLALFVAWPVTRALAGAFVAEEGGATLAAFAQRVGGERIWGLGCLTANTHCGVAWNTLFLALLTAFSTTLLGTLLALLAERDSHVIARPLGMLALLPIVTPPFVVGLGLILLFGRAGLFNQALEAWFGIPPGRWFYGLTGIWMAQTFAFTPVAFLILRGVVAGVAPGLEEAARTLRAGPAQVFSSITLPLMRPGIANAFLVGFVESMADFGNPIVVGGQYAVLSTDIFFAIVGAQFDQGRAAALALLLLVFALTAFALQRRALGARTYVTVGGKGDAGLPSPLPPRVRRIARAIALPWLAFTAAIYLFAFAGGFVRTWGRDSTFTLAHFAGAFGIERGDYGLVWSGTAWNSLFNTLTLAGIAAPLTAAAGLMIAWLSARTRFRGRGAFEFAALMSFAIPGTVLGVSYVLAFNVPPLELTGTGLVIVLCFVFRNLPVGVRAGSAALAQVDRALDEASLMLRASNARTLVHVVLPLIKPALATALVYSFVRAITTVSAVIFLVTAETELATTYIIGRVGNGDYGLALAYCTVLIALMSAATLLIHALVGERRLGRRGAAA